MADRSSRAAQQYTVTVDGYSVSGWSEVTEPDQDVVTGSYTPGGSRGAVVTVGLARQTGTLTLVKQYNHAEFTGLDRRRGREGSVSGAKVDTDGRIVNSYEPRSGVLKGITRGGMDAQSGDALMMTARFEVDG